MKVLVTSVALILKTVILHNFPRYDNDIKRIKRISCNDCNCFVTFMLLMRFVTATITTAETAAY